MSDGSSLALRPWRSDSVTAGFLLAQKFTLIFYFTFNGMEGPLSAPDPHPRGHRSLLGILSWLSSLVSFPSVLGARPSATFHEGLFLMEKLFVLTVFMTLWP